MRLPIDTDKMSRVLLTLPGFLCLSGALLFLSTLEPREWGQSGKSGSDPELNYENPDSVENSELKTGIHTNQKSSDGSLQELSS